MDAHYLDMRSILPKTVPKMVKEYKARNILKPIPKPRTIIPIDKRYQKLITRGLMTQKIQYIKPILKPIPNRGQLHQLTEDIKN